MSVFQEVLKNKTVLITEPVDTAKTVSIGFWFSVGSRYENAGFHGISHFVEHLLFKGTKTRSAYDIACAFDYIGSYVNAFTDREAVCVHCTVPAEKLDYALEVFCDMTENSLFNADDIEKERTVIESEIISSLDDPEEAASDAVCQLVWKNQTISQSISGSLDDVRKLTREQLYQWYKKYFVNGKLTVTIAGNIQIDKIKNILENLGNRQEQKIEEGLFDDKFPPLVWNNTKKMLKAPFQQEQVFLLYPVSSSKSFHETSVRNVFNAIAGDTMSSRLFQRLREKGGFCYNVYSYFNMFCDGGFWCAYASSAKKDVENLITEILDEVKNLLNGGITESELEGAKQHLCGEEIIAGEDIEQRTKRLIRSYINTFPYFSTEEIIDDISKVTKKEVDDFIQDIFANKKGSLIIYGRKLSLKKRHRIFHNFMI